MRCTRQHRSSHHALRLTAFFTLLTFLWSSVTYAATTRDTLRGRQIGDDAAKSPADKAKGGLEELAGQAGKLVAALLGPTVEPTPEVLSFDSPPGESPYGDARYTDPDYISSPPGESYY